MIDDATSFQLGIEFPSVLRAISKEIYETPHAFIRENVQNAIDAVRMQALRDGNDPSDEVYWIKVVVDGKSVTVQDNGIGMSREELQQYFWTIGSSGKRGEDAQKAGCVGMFGIGGFANFGVCETVEVTSQDSASGAGTVTRLSATEIREAGASIPLVAVGDSSEAAPRGTVVVGTLKSNPDAEQLKTYLKDFVQFVPIAITFDGTKISQQSFRAGEQTDNLAAVVDAGTEWATEELKLVGRLWADRGHTMVATIEKLVKQGDSVPLQGRIRFENGTIDVLKRGFKLCATTVPSTIGISGRLDCDLFVPTAGRDSLDAPTTSLLCQLASILEDVAVEAVLASSDRIAQHTRIFRFITHRGWLRKMNKVPVCLADGTEITLGEIEKRANEGGVGVFFGTTQKHALNQVMQAQGHLVVRLSGDRFRRAAEQGYLERYCKAKPFEGIIDCAVMYEDLTRFERIFLSEIEQNIAKSYELKNVKIIPGSLTEDIPTFVKERSRSQPIEIFVDTRHREVTKLEGLGLTPLFYSLTAVFCRVYIGPALKKWSPRFFGDGALNLELFSRRRSEIWILVKDDIGVIRKGGQRQVVTREDVAVINVKGQAGQEQEGEIQGHRLLQIVDEDRETEVGGYYVRLPDWAFAAYGDLVGACDSHGVVWVGNKIVFVASDGVSAQFQYQIQLDEIVATQWEDGVRTEGVVELDRGLQELFGSVYFPIPHMLERFLVPKGDEEIRLNLDCEWFDMRTRKLWEVEKPRE